jgi:hypothetical protein
MSELFRLLKGNPNSPQGPLAGSLTLPPLWGFPPVDGREAPALAGALGPEPRTFTFDL